MQFTLSKCLIHTVDTFTNNTWLHTSTGHQYSVAKGVLLCSFKGRHRNNTIGFNSQCSTYIRPLKIALWILKINCNHNLTQRVSWKTLYTSLFPFLWLFVNASSMIGRKWILTFGTPSLFILLFIEILSHRLVRDEDLYILWATHAKLLPFVGVVQVTFEAF